MHFLTKHFKQLDIELYITSAYTLSFRRTRAIQEQSLTLPNKIELISGIATVIFAICTPVVMGVSYKDFVAYILVAFVVAAGSYLHVMRRMIAGFVLVLIAGGLVSFIGVVGVAILAASTVDNWIVLLIYLPGWTAFITVIAAIITQLRRRERRQQKE